MKILISGKAWLLLFLWGVSIPLNSNTYTASLQAKAEWNNVAKIVAIGDIHGAYDEFVAILQELSLIDQKSNWVGGKTHLVQTGDSLDRGTQDRKVMDLLMELEKQAEKAGGRVHSLLGNHEVMNVIGDLRYVNGATYATYASEKSEELREKTYTRYVKYRASRAERNIPKQTFTPHQKFKEDWMTAHPPGYLEHRKAFSETGVYGRWFSNKNALLKLDDTVFLHGGIAESYSQLSLREINERMRRELKTFYEMRGVLVRNGILEDYLDFDEMQVQVSAEINYLVAKGGADDPQVLNALQYFQAAGKWLMTDPNGPLWYRGLAQEPEETFKPILSKIKTNLGAARFVIGHTPSLTGIANRFSSDVVLIDTGMLRTYYKGICAALVIENGKFSPVYPKRGACS